MVLGNVAAATFHFTATVSQLPIKETHVPEPIPSHVDGVVVIDMALNRSYITHIVENLGIRVKREAQFAPDLDRASRLTVWV